MREGGQVGISLSKEVLRLITHCPPVQNSNIWAKEKKLSVFFFREKTSEK